MFLTFFAGAFLLWGCQSESNKSNNHEVIFGKIQFSDGWARPGSIGQNSGIFLVIGNGTATTDTLIGVNSDIAEKTEIHESFEEASDVEGMRPAGNQIIKAGNKLTLEPGGLHIMLMDLKQELKEGDSLAVSLKFSRNGTKTVSIPVKIQQ